jgi:hypothetical protein
VILIKFVETAHGGGVVCSNKGCEEPVRSKGLCFNHGGGIRCKTNKCINRARDSSGYCHRHRRIHLEVQELQQELKLNSEQEVNDGCLTALLLTAAVAEPQNRRHASEIQTSKRHNSSENIAIV